MVNDRRTPEQVKETVLYVVANDRFMSGWGLAPKRSLFAVACTAETYEDVERRMRTRSEMKRVRVNSRLPRVHDGDHLSIIWHTEFTYQPH